MLNEEDYRKAKSWTEPIKNLLDSNIDLIELSEVTSVAIGDLDSPRKIIEKHLSKSRLSIPGNIAEEFQVELLEVILKASLLASEERKKRREQEDSSTPENVLNESSRKTTEKIFQGLDQLVEQFDLDKDQQQYAFTLFMSGLRLLNRPPKSETKHSEALFAISIANFELFFSTLMNLYLSEFPRGFNMVELGVTYEQIKQLGAIEELDDLCREKQIDQIMGQNFKKWVNWFSARDKLLVDEGKLANYNQISDLILLRNILLHNGGVVARRHEEVAINKKDFLIGKKVSLSRISLRNTVTQLNSFAFSLWFMVATKIQSRNEYIEGFTTDIEVTLLKSKQARVIFQNQDLINSRFSSDVLSVNYWLACQQLEKKEYLVEVEKWKPNQEDKILLLAKEILLGNLGSASLMASELLSTRDLGVNEWLEWPLFASLRNSDSLGNKTLN